MKDSLEKFLFFLNNYEEEAFRLEILPTYDVSHESEDFKDFLEHKKISINKDLKEYIDIHSSKILQGKRHIRARVIPSPLTDYFRYETNV